MIAGQKSNDLNDDLSDLIGSEPRQPISRAPADFKPIADRMNEEPCPKCRGTGVWRGYAHSGPCFQCGGTGKLTFKTTREERTRNRTNAAARKAKKGQQAIEAFKTEFADVWAWMDGSTFPPAVEMRAKLDKWGTLLPGSIDFARRMIAKREEAAKAAEDRTANAPVVAGVDRLKAAFDKAAAFTAAKPTDSGIPLRLRSPKITIGSVTISPAKATSANAGALYVKDAGEYMGKIASGKFFASRECTEEQRTRILAFIADPKAAAEAYGKETGMCCVCNATLTSKWRLRGIGPICAEKMGW